MKLLDFRTVGLCILLGALLNVRPAHAQAYTSVNAFPGLMFPNAVCLASPPGESNRLFVVEKHGRISVITNLDNPTRTVFMDISDRVTVDNSDEASDVTGEDGVLGLAFHPGYSSNGLFYVYYTGQATNGTTDTHDILSSFKVSSGNPNQGDPSSEVRLIAQYDRYNNHNGGDLHFGPDGYLYVSLGDEGDANNSQGNAQHIDRNFFSGILRIDVDKRHGNSVPHTNSEFASSTNYAIPSDNPFVGATKFDGLSVSASQLRTEFWAVGLRNPWRFSFDPATGVLYCGDVGQDFAEEIDIITKGGNYGWATYEGTNFTPGVVTNGWPVPQNPIFPIVTIIHDAGEAIIGGVVYHGSTLPGLEGAYIYGDNVTGLMNWLIYDGNHVTSSGSVMNDAGVSAFGIDPSTGDVLYCNLQDGNNSIIKRIVPAVSGALQVTIDPPNAVSAGAQWQIGNGPFQDSGTTVSNIAVGNVNVSFKSVPGFTTPASETVAITQDTTTMTNATYVSTDTTKPTVTITSPKSNQDVSNAVITATGTAKDKVAVAQVWVQVNGNEWVLASGTNTWSATNLSLAPGANTLRAYSVDTSSNISTTNSVTFIYGVRTSLIVNISGQGTISPDYNGEMLEIGKSFSMTAKPAKGSAFTNWSGSMPANKTKLTFVMASNLVFTANFIDVTRPVDIITFPTKNLSTTNPVITATGKASDNVGVTSVFYQLNGGGWSPAASGNSFTNWTASDLALLSGPNEIDAWAADATGNHSLTNSILFSHVVTPTADWAPDSLSGLVAESTVDSGGTPVNLGFDLIGFSSTGETNTDFALGGYFYDKFATNMGVVTFTNTAPPAQSNIGNHVWTFTFTNHYVGTFVNQTGAPSTIQFVIATNLLPTSLEGKSFIGTGASAGSHVTTLKFGKNSTLTVTPSISGVGKSSTATYTFARFSPVAGLLSVTFTGADAGMSASLEISFTSKGGGNYLVETFDNTETLQDMDTGTFVFH